MTEPTGTPLATYDFYWGLGNTEEIIRRGDPVPCCGTGIMNAREQARSLVKIGAAVWSDSPQGMKLQGAA